jgi:hypothetical protein
MATMGDEAAWEALWAPYDEETYTRALAYVPSGATVLDIGAGDLRLAIRIARFARFVYAIERNPALLAGGPRLSNLIAVCGDARTLPFPAVDTGVLLMRHCRYFGLYRRKLEAVGCVRLITNARWRMGVECIDLTVAPIPYVDLGIGWYACRCGATGFRPGATGRLTARVAENDVEVDHCPECADHGWNSYRLS